MNPTERGRAVDERSADTPELRKRWGECPMTPRSGGLSVEFDSTPMLKGLPGDRCPCPHWGYVFKGRVTYTFADREEVHEAGDAFYVEGGHLQRADAGTEYLQFSPADELRTVSETIMQNMQRMHGS